MIDSENLRTASLYINNQLLSRGLLRDGQNIQFSDPEGGPGGLEGTMGRIISVVNDLILRRDRDAANRESLSTTLHTLRVESQRQTTDYARQADKLADTRRRLDSAEATERALRAQLKTAEQSAQKLQAELAKTKVLVSQTRAACANEVRRRDRQIDGLKKAVTDAGRVRGGGKSRDVVVINVTGDVGAGEEDSNGGAAPGATEDDGYSLRMETNGFLTELARGLSEENEGLLAIVRKTVDQLRDMGGLERLDTEENGGGGGVSLSTSVKASKLGDDVAYAAPQKGAGELAAELEDIMEHLRTILTNPSFVPIEEVEIREDEINRLRQGWERMESRWRDAVHMIDGWRQRMVNSGKGVDMEELRMGLRLSPVRVRNVEETADDDDDMATRLSCVQEEDEEAEERAYEEERRQALQSPSPEGSLHLVPAPGFQVEEADDSDSDSSIFQDDVDIEELEVEEPNVRILQQSMAESVDLPPLPPPPQLRPLKNSDTAGNRGARKPPSYGKRRGDFTTIVEENTRDVVAEKAPAPPPHATMPRRSQENTKVSPQQTQEQARSSSTTSAADSPLFGKSNEAPSPSKQAGPLFAKPRTAASRPERTARPTQDPVPRNTRQRPAATNNPSSSDSAAAQPAAKRTASDPSPATKPQGSGGPAAAGAAEQPPAPHSKSAPRTRSPVRAPPSSSRLPRPNNPPAPQQSPLTMAHIAAKLAASEREADAARVRAKLKAARAGRRVSIVPPPADNTDPASVPLPADDDVVDPVKKDMPAAPTAAPAAVGNNSGTRGTATAMEPTSAEDKATGDERDELAMSTMSTDRDDKGGAQVFARGGGAVIVEKTRTTTTTTATEKRKRDVAGAVGGVGGGARRRSSKVAARRRSTLSPWELDSLIQGNLNVESPAR